MPYEAPCVLFEALVLPNGLASSPFNSGWPYVFLAHCTRYGLYFLSKVGNGRSRYGGGGGDEWVLKVEAWRDGASGTCQGYEAWSWMMPSMDGRGSGIPRRSSALFDFL